uniref:Uncharacterized protein n=1 Tax=Leptocylindrus aporus TaxID=1398097 RepID=A0A7S0K9N2_9STRA|mmetsp:Transcript_365/g.474  ORF Transcript_365/g.474 Transcript_365/m.474 type:complete len:330 (+) Transcript_365:134-1123(+)|eukprot:CAMPEP_0116064078 /NCGR_PEP_ID=MMETSP0322-20121206/8865_1 /TAXON_ID=163516 /ORGANISM="Leptocylindrus danicus var. apora, Strain B651" /LENGTH=329 /DNA_ID=CAMNT_0003549957 /DNA_START=115 /DNA_END=1104 /DNA_ORIENTATION=+
MNRGLAFSVLFLCAGNANAFVSTRLNFGTSLLRQKQLSDENSRLQLSQETNEEVSSVNEVVAEASDALQSVGWASPASDEELTSDDPFVQRINDEIMRDMGVPLDGLLNPATVVNLERDLYNLRSSLATLTGLGEIDVGGLTTQECDGGGNSDEIDALRQTIEKKEKKLVVERRSVFRGWLKNVFLVQAVLSLGVSFVMATDPAILFGGFGWFYSYQMELPIQVLGFWWWWLFIVPSLRSRRPSGPEKKALDLAFIGTPLISLVAPVATKDALIIWWANFAVTAASYGYAYTIGDSEDDESDDSNTPEALKFIYKSLDFGSGRERGARK